MSRQHGRDRNRDFVVGTGAASTTPDVVVLETRFSCDGRDVASALSACTDAVTAAIAAAVEHQVGDQDRASTGIGVNQRWDNTGAKIAGYTAFHTLRFAVRDQSKVGPLIAALAKATGNAFGLDNVSLRVSDPAPLAKQAREAAMADAHDKAAEYAAHAGRTLGQVIRVTEDGGVAPMPKMLGAGRAMAVADSAMPVEAGESTVTSSVRVRYSLD